MADKIAKTIQPPEKRTDGLPVGSQAKFIEAAKCAAILGFPINTLLTVRWSSLYHHDNANPLFAQSPVERIAYLVELLRKWIGARCRGGFQYLWVREATSELGEHWHLAFHLPHGKRKAIASYLSDLLGEPLDHTPRTKAQGRTEGEFACSVWGSWHLAKDTHPERSGFYLAAYLGKGAQTGHEGAPERRFKRHEGLRYGSGCQKQERRSAALSVPLRAISKITRF